MQVLVKKYIPNAPKIGLYVIPNIPPDKLNNALRDYAGQVDSRDVLALYDATLMGSAKDGAVFLRDRVVYQNNDLEPTQVVRYDDIVNVKLKKRFLGGKEVRIDANSAHATVTYTLDFSGRPDAAEYVVRFLHETMVQGAIEDNYEAEIDSDGMTQGGSDRHAVREALTSLYRQGKLSVRDYQKLIDVLRQL